MRYSGFALRRLRATQNRHFDVMRRNSVQDRERVWLLDQFGIDIEEKIKAAIRFRFINLASHQDVGRVMIAFGFDKALVKSGEFRVNCLEFAPKDLEFFTTAS